MPADAGVRVSPKILIEIYRQQNQSLPEVKALTSERLRKHERMHPAIVRRLDDMCRVLEI